MADKDNYRVSDSEDVGTANARADHASIMEGERNYGKNSSNIRNRAGTYTGEPTVSPLIYITPKKGYNYSKGGRVKAGTDTCCDQFPHTSKAR